MFACDVRCLRVESTSLVAEATLSNRTTTGIGEPGPDRHGLGMGERSSPASDRRALDVSEVWPFLAGLHSHPQLEDVILVNFALPQTLDETLTIRPELTNISRYSIVQS